MSNRLKARAVAAVLSIFAEIGDDGNGGGVTAEAFNKELAALGKITSLTVRVNSPGGDVMQGMGIYNALAAIDCEVTCRIEGMAASAASLIAMAADRVEIAANSFMLIHEPFAGVLGTADDLQTAADDMQKMTGTYVAIYAARTGMDSDAVLALMKEDRLMTADEAVKLGFADVVFEPKEREPAKIDAKALSTRHRAQLDLLAGAKPAAKKGQIMIKKPSTKTAAKATADDDGLTLSSLNDKLEAIQSAIAALAAKADDGNDEGDDEGADDNEGDEGDDGAGKDPAASDDGDGDESDDGPTENRGAGKKAKAHNVKAAAAFARAYASEVIDLCNLAGFSAQASGYIAANEPVAVVRKKLLAARKAKESGKTITHRNGDDGKKPSAEAVTASWDVAIAKAFPTRKK